MFPSLAVPLTLAPGPSAEALQVAAHSDSKLLVFVAQQTASAEAGGHEVAPPYDIGVAARVIRMTTGEDGTVDALIHGVARVHIDEIREGANYPRARVSLLPDLEADGNEVSIHVAAIRAAFAGLTATGSPLDQSILAAIESTSDPIELADFVAANASFAPAERQQLLETLDVTERLRLTLALLQREARRIEIGHEIASEAQLDMERQQRELILREQLQAIRRQLGEDNTVIEQLRARLDVAGLPEDVRTVAHRELERLTVIPVVSPEYTIVRTYLEWLADLPWASLTDDRLDIEEAAHILNDEHYGLTKAKEHILDYLAVRQLRGDARGPILCFVGPPGVGKTSLGLSIAHAMERRFVRFSVGGLRDEAVIRGFRRTYVAALPGRIIQELRRVGTRNPVMMLDEIDKLGSDVRGDPAAALLEVLDPEQNAAFFDHYLDLPFDLSAILFICTANRTDTIPPPLLDRMELVEIAGYTEAEKLEIARRYIVPRRMREAGLEKQPVRIDDEALRKILRDYTREAGVRNLERAVGGVIRWIARRVAGRLDVPPRIGRELLESILGPPRYREEFEAGDEAVGVATGLAATGVGGDVIHVEAAVVPGDGHLTLTGQLGSVMRESATGALTYVRSRASQLNIPADFFATHDVHVHVPAAAVSKDGPSAGIPLTTAIVSAATGRAVRRRIAATGEITLRGRVLPVGAVKEKVLAAHRMGLRKVVLPLSNQGDWQEVPEEARADFTVHWVDSVDAALAILLREDP